MSLESELQRVKREQEMALQAAQEAERKAQAHRSRLRQAILSQRQALVADWTRTVAALLDALGKSAWGEDAYTLIEPDGTSSLSWFVVHVEGKTKSNYQVTLQLEEASSEDLSLSPEDRLVRPTGFVVAGAQEHTCSLSQESLKGALVLAYKGGPKGNGLDQWAEAILAKSPYKKGEYEATNKWVLLSMLFSLLTGVGVVGLVGLVFLWGVSIASGPGLVGTDLLTVIAIIALLTLFGFGILAISVVALWRTSFGKRFRRLPTVEKALTVIAAIPGALMAFAMSAGLIVIVIAIVVLLAGAAAGASREERVSEIEEGVRRAIR